jgi:secondary thiamine-phosphate synthase enzyme
MTTTNFASFQTKGFNDIIDITSAVQRFVTDNGLNDGALLIFVPGSTAAISTIEYESGLIQDLPERMEKIAPIKDRYHHDDTWHDGNGYAHIRSTLMGPSFTVPVINGRLNLGTWQQIILVDFDNRPRTRKVTMQFTGDKA